jgi:hypothetical protein
MKNFHYSFLVIFLFTGQSFFTYNTAAYSIQNHPGNGNNFLFESEKKACHAAYTGKNILYRNSFTNVQKKVAVTGQPIAYKFKISYKKFNKQKALSKENFHDIDFEFSKFSCKKIGKNNNLLVSRKSV